MFMLYLSGTDLKIYKSMKNIKIFEEFINEGDRYDNFLSYVDGLPEKHKEELSNMWMGSGQIVSTIASALWTSMRTGNSFKTNALNFLEKKGLTAEKAQKALDDFIEKYK
jgi:hypothetical protein